VQSTLPRKHWLGIEFRHLAALAAIAEEGSFRAAADRLGYVQSAVSQQIDFLERTLDVRLIERARGSYPVALTDAGRLVLGHFEDILIKFGAAWADVEALSRGRAGAVHVAAAANVEVPILPEVLARLAHESRVHVRATQQFDDDACAAVAENRVDAALISGPVPDAPLVAHRLIEDPLVMLVHSDAPLARRGTAPRLTELGSLALIGRSAARDTETAYAEFEALGIQPRIVHASDNDATVHALVANGVGAAILPALSVDWDDDAVAALPLEKSVRPRVLSLVWHAERELTPTLETFFDATIAACREIQRELDKRLAHPLALVESA
jgi:DNA-binding transcriptional LysR family regulator